ncbi:MAG: zinc-dependent metalloprotease [Bacteroidales bacterium]|nr:zinc-dependent metalloprotease [Bacteroidales bacterium]
MKILNTLLALLIFSGQLVATEIKTKDTTARKDSVSSYDKLFKEKHETVSGMFKLHKMKGKVYFEIPVNMLGKEMLIASTVTETSDNGNGIVGSKADPVHFIFSKSGESVHIRRLNCDVVTDNADSGIADAIRKSNIGSIIKSFKVEAYSKDSSAIVIDMTGFFTGENKDLSPFDQYSQYTMFMGLKRDVSFQQERSFIGNIKAFTDNVAVSSTLSYTYTLTDQRSNKALAKDVPFTAVVSRSIVLLKDKPVRPRIADYRVAVFNTGKSLFGEKEQSSKPIYYANRWNLEPSDTAAFKAGKLVEPKKPITFYIDTNFPESWKPKIKEAVEQWNELFEKVGFKNAIKAVDFPTNDSEFDPDNIKYSCIRYAPLGVENAMGPSWVDPRSGEIINASVYVYHDIIKLLNNWMFVQISPADKRLRSRYTPDDILKDGIRYVIAHEIGHCLGFMHNMSASNVIPVDSLRSATYTQKHGTTTSIMDYARFNYVAQPGDMERGVKVTPPRFGDYDRFLIKWSYSVYPDIKTEKEESDILSKMVSDSIKNPVYRYGLQLSYPLDPRSQTEDLGDDAIKASEYGIKNLKYLIENLNSWVGAEDEDFSYRSDIYEGVVYQYIRYINHIYANIGGIYLNEVKVADGIEPFKSVEREKQQAALRFIMSQIGQLEWLDNETLKNNLTIMGSAKELLGTVLAKAIIASPSKVMLSSYISEDPYTFTECADDVFDFVWKRPKGKNLTSLQRYLQTEYIKGTIGESKVSASLAGISSPENKSMFDILECEDNQGIFTKQLQQQRLMEKTNTSVAYDIPSRKFVVTLNYESNHYKYLLKSKKTLESLVRSASKDDKSHYELLLKQVNAALKVE